MTNLESGTTETKWNTADRRKFLQIYEIIEDLLTDDDEDSVRPDLQKLTWDELNSLEESTQQSQIAKNTIHYYYLHALEEIYPQLADVKSGDEMLQVISAIPDLPPCKGTYVISHYHSDDGKRRAVSSTKVDLGDHGIVESLFVMDHSDGLIKSYNIGKSHNGDLWGGTGINPEKDLYDNELLQMVHPSQASNMRRIINGTVHEYQLEDKLMEIRIMTEELMTEPELDELIVEARCRYYVALQRNKEADENGIDELTKNDVHDLHQIVSDRLFQLASES